MINKTNSDNMKKNLVNMRKLHKTAATIQPGVLPVPGTNLILTMPPCETCPYTLGHVKFFDNPCPECKSSEYSTYYELMKPFRGYEGARMNNHT